MKSTGVFLGVAALLGGVLAIALPVATAVPAKSTQLESSVRLGGHWYGEQIDLKELRGKVVLYEFWGIN